MGTPLRIVLGLLCIAFVRPAIAIDLDAVYELSLANDPRFQAAQYQYKIVQEAIPQARSALLPFASASFEYSETNQDIKRTDNSVFAQGQASYPSQNLNLTVTQPIFRFSDWAGLQQAKAEVKQAYAGFAAAQQELILRTAELYLGVLAAEDNLAFSNAELKAVERQRELTRTRHQSGLATRTDVYDADARYASVSAQQIVAQNRLDDAYQALRESVGVFVTDLQPLGETLPLETPDPDDIDTWVERALEQDLGLEAARQAVAVAEQEVRRQRGGHYPTLEFVARLDSRDTDGSLFGGGSEVEQANYAVRLSVPIYQGGSTNSGVRQANLELRQAQEQLKLEELIVIRETRAAFLGVNSGIGQVNALAKSVMAQEGALETKQKGFKAGLNTALIVLDAERDLFFINRDFAQSRYDYLLSTLRLKRLTGTLSEADLRYVNGLLVEGDAQ